MEKMKIKVIRSVIVPLLVSALIHIFALSVFIFDIFHILPELFEVLMVLISIFVYPLAPIFYGLQTKDRIGSVIVGTVPILCLFYELHLNSFIAGNVPETERILDIFTYIAGIQRKRNIAERRKIRSRLSERKLNNFSYRRR